MLENKQPQYNEIARHAQKIGLINGYFAPFCQSNYQMVIKSLCENDLTLVIGYDDIPSALARQIRHLKTFFQNEPSVFVAGQPFPITKNLAAIPQLLAKAQVNLNQLRQLTWYTAKTSEEDLILANLKQAPKTLANKINLVKSAWTGLDPKKIQANPFKYFDQITKPFRADYVKKIAFIGAPSTGKTTLIRRLAQSFNASFSEETARDLEVSLAINDDDLTVDDYRFFVTSQHEVNQKAVLHSTNGLAFLDTTPLATAVYAKLYLTEDQYQSLKPLFDYYINLEPLDLIIATKPTGIFALDGGRSEEWADDGLRFFEELKRQAQMYHLSDRFVALDTIGPDYSFYDRYCDATAKIKNIL